MRIAVLGTGNVGQTIAAELDRLGHEVALGTRDVQATLARTEPDSYGNPPLPQWLSDHRSVKLQSFADAAKTAELVVNATSGAATLDALHAAGAENLSDKTLIDIANPLDFSTGTPPSLNPTNTDSLAEQIQRTFPELKVVKALNTMNAKVMVDPSRVPGAHNVFISGNDAQAKQNTTDLLVSFGWPPTSVIDLGDITTARGTEMLLPIWLRLLGTLGHTDFNFHIQSA